MIIKVCTFFHKLNYLKIFTFLIIIFFVSVAKKRLHSNSINICICTLAKNENLYIREFIEYYKNYGVDKIFLYDNNDINGEKFEDVISDYIKSRFVEILNWRGIKKAMLPIMNHCYTTNSKEYDLLIFYEIDEQINLYNYTNIKNFLVEEKFKKCQLIYLNLVCHTDNNKLYYENKTLRERFPNIVPISKSNIFSIKFIIRGNISNVIIRDVHKCNDELVNCNGFGHSNKIQGGHYSTEPDIKYYYINHYFSKSTEEFINKMKRGDALITDYKNYQMIRVIKYFSQSEITKEKIQMIEKETQLNLSMFKKNISKKE